MTEDNEVIGEELIGSVFEAVAGMLDKKPQFSGNTFRSILSMIDKPDELSNYPFKKVLTELGLAKIDGKKTIMNESACRVFKACFQIEDDRLVLNHPKLEDFGSINSVS